MSKLRSQLMWASLALVAFVQLVAFRSYVMDDSLISLRFARNLLGGHGLVWNVGDGPVEGFTSFLWVLVLALWQGVTGDPGIGFGRAAGILLLVATVVLLGRHLARQHGHRAAALAVAPIAIGTPYLLNAVSGMETGLAVFLSAVAHLGMAGWVESRSRGALVQFLLGSLLACMTRPDFAACFVVTAIAMVAATRRTPTRAELGLVVGCFVLPGLAYFLGRWAYFGHILPNTFYVKAGGTTSSSVVYVATFLAVYATTPLGVALRAQLGGGSRTLAGIVGPAFLVPVLCFLAISPMMGVYWRFLLPYYVGIPLVTAACFAGPRIPRLVLAVHLALPLALFPLAAEFAGRMGQVATTLEATGRALADVATGGSLALNDVGFVPYFSEWTTLDTVGLCDEQLAHGVVTRQERVAQFAPDLLVLHDPRGRIETLDPQALGLTEVFRLPYLRGTSTSDLVFFGVAGSPVAERLSLRLGASPPPPAQFRASVVQSCYDAIRSLYHR